MAYVLSCSAGRMHFARTNFGMNWLFRCQQSFSLLLQEKGYTSTSLVNLNILLSEPSAADMSVLWPVLCVVMYCAGTCTAVNWLEWWTYDGISGPSFWGLINPEWALCNQVRGEEGRWTY